MPSWILVNSLSKNVVIAKSQELFYLTPNCEVVKIFFLFTNFIIFDSNKAFSDISEKTKSREIGRKSPSDWEKNLLVLEQHTPFLRNSKMFYALVEQLCKYWHQSTICWAGISSTPCVELIQLLFIQALTYSSVIKDKRIDAWITTNFEEQNIICCTVLKQGDSGKIIPQFVKKWFWIWIIRLILIVGIEGKLKLLQTCLQSMFSLIAVQICAEFFRLCFNYFFIVIAFSAFFTCVKLFRYSTFY